MCTNNSWGTICTNTWDDLDASVACRESGYSPYGWLSHFYIMRIIILMIYFVGSVALLGGYDTNEWPPVMYDITCTGEETSLWNCSYNLTDNGGTCRYDASVICRGKIIIFVFLSPQVDSIIILFAFALLQIQRQFILTVQLVKYA